MKNISTAFLFVSTFLATSGYESWAGKIGDEENTPNQITSAPKAPCELPLSKRYDRAMERVKSRPKDLNGYIDLGAFLIASRNDETVKTQNTIALQTLTLAQSQLQGQESLRLASDLAEYHTIPQPSLRKKRLEAQLKHWQKALKDAKGTKGKKHRTAAKVRHAATMVQTLKTEVAEFVRKVQPALAKRVVHGNALALKYCAQVVNYKPGYHMKSVFKALDRIIENEDSPDSQVDQAFGLKIRYSKRFGETASWYGCAKTVETYKYYIGWLQGLKRQRKIHTGDQRIFHALMSLDRYIFDQAKNTNQYASGLYTNPNHNKHNYLVLAQLCEAQYGLVGQHAKLTRNAYVEAASLGSLTARDYILAKRKAFFPHDPFAIYMFAKKAYEATKGYYGKSEFPRFLEKDTSTEGKLMWFMHKGYSYWKKHQSNRGIKYTPDDMSQFAKGSYGRFIVDGLRIAALPEDSVVQMRLEETNRVISQLQKCISAPQKYINDYGSSHSHGYKGKWYVFGHRFWNTYGQWEYSYMYHSPEAVEDELFKRKESKETQEAQLGKRAKLLAHRKQVLREMSTADLYKKTRVYWLLVANKEMLSTPVLKDYLLMLEVLASQKHKKGLLDMKKVYEHIVDRSYLYKEDFSESEYQAKLKLVQGLIAILDNKKLNADQQQIAYEKQLKNLLG